jgi:hypothetical protein
MSLSSFNKVDCWIRLPTATDKNLGLMLDYLRLNGFDIQREVEVLFEIVFLPFALYSGDNSQAAMDAAAYSLAQLESFRSTIQELYQL